MSAICSIIGATFCDKFGRRPIILFYFIGYMTCWIAIIAGTSIYAKTGSSSAAIAGIVFYWFSSVVGSTAATPLQALWVYPTSPLIAVTQWRFYRTNNAPKVWPLFSLPVALR